MKVIFVDIDGPLSYGTWDDGSVKITEDLTIPYAWEKDQCEVLAEIITETGAKVIVSSDWKKHFTVDQLNSVFEYYGIPPVVIGVTDTQKAKISSWLDMDRAYQIARWLQQNRESVEEWIAIDDLNLGKWFEEMTEEHPYITKNHHVWIFGDWAEVNTRLADCADKIINHLNGRK